MLLARDVDNSNLFLFSGAYSLSQQDKQGKLWFPAGWTITLKRFDSLSLVTHISHSADVWEQTREELGNLSSFTSNVMLLFAVSAGRELTALNWSTTQGDLSALFTVIKTGISNAVLDFLTLRGLEMLGLAQQWWDSSWWSPGLLQKWCSRGWVLMYRLEQADTAWVFSAFTRVVGDRSSWSAKSAFPREKYVRRCCPWLSYLEGAVVLVGGQTFSLFSFFLFYGYFFLSLSLFMAIFFLVLAQREVGR